MSIFLIGQKKPFNQHIEELSKSKTRVGMVWLKWIILETIADVLAISTYKHPSPLHASNMLFIWKNRAFFWLVSSFLCNLQMCKPFYSHCPKVELTHTCNYKMIILGYFMYFRSEKRLNLKKIDKNSLSTNNTISPEQALLRFWLSHRSPTTFPWIRPPVLENVSPTYVFGWLTSRTL